MVNFFPKIITAIKNIFHEKKHSCLSLFNKKAFTPLRINSIINLKNFFIFK